ncbi:MAG: penicillin-binding protein 2 [Deltaproteobacteria bacterium]|nr:MAG: penicillin-binding protein 2 [Deltaproteobacteria bacterium]
MLFTVLFVVLMGRFFWIQIVRGDEYRERARVSFTTKERLPARRGEIKDRNGQVLARNVAHHSLTVLPQKLRKPEVRKEVLDRLANLLALTRERREEIEGLILSAIENDAAWHPVVVDDDLVSTSCPYDSGALELAKDEPGKERQLLYCAECGITHEGLPPDTERCPHDQRKLTWDSPDHHTATCPKCKRTFVGAPVCPNDGTLLAPIEKNLECPVCKRRFTDEVAVLTAHRHELPGVHIDTEFVRDYPSPFLAAHLLGYMNLVNAEDREAAPGVYPLDARVGRSGVERALEPVLRGESGTAEYFKGSDKRVASNFVPATDGLDVWLTLDARLQKAVRQAMRYQRSGAAVVLGAQTGEVLALYSVPGFDPNAWSRGLSSEDWAKIEENPYDPLINKALTPYAPGSVYKIVASLATLHDHQATAEDTINCPGFYEFAGRPFGCHYKAGHGPVDLVHALKYSCDVYFYKTGEKLGMDRLAEYGHMFGYGEPTGIEVYERAGRVPTKAYHETTSLGFQPGLTLSTAIGQGSLTASPLQVARSFAAVANGGHLMKAHVVKEFTDKNGVVVQRFLPVEESRIDATPEELATIREGLVRVVNDADGTGREARLDSMVVAGKTGTAEAAQSRPGASAELKQWLLGDHAWFASYAPADDPQVVVVVFIEHGGGGGKHAAPIAREILRAWMRLGLARPTNAGEAPPTAEGG